MEVEQIVPAARKTGCIFREPVVRPCELAPWRIGALALALLPRTATPCNHGPITFGSRIAVAFFARISNVA